MKERSFYEKGEWDNCMNRRKKFPLISQVKEGISIDANKLSYYLATHGGVNSKECPQFLGWSSGSKLPC